jgi:hypothetical protein
MAYEFLYRLDERNRFRELSRRTADQYLAQKRPLTAKEMQTLWHLDAREVSRFVGEVFSVVEDRRLPPETQNEYAARPRPRLDGAPPGARTERDNASVHAMLCEYLVLRGTRQAIPGLSRAIDAGRFLSPSPTAPWRMEWVAAFSIAVRDPWPGADLWLAGLIGRTEPIVEGRLDPAEAGATAAALLLIRHGRRPEDYGLEASTAIRPEAAGFDAYRFASADARGRVLAWWKQQWENSQQRSGDGP